MPDDAPENNVMQPGYRIEHYVIIEQIGQGGQAAVWSAEDERLKRTVAIKTINVNATVAPVVGGSSGYSGTLPSVEEQAKRFRSEAQTIAELEHPFILPVYGFGQQGDWLYIIMRYMAGGTLKKLIQSQQQTLDDVIKIAGPLADALDLAHERNIVHRDIKSVNILLDAQHRPYLADFGLSVTVGDASSQSGSGTVAYMSPEQMQSKPFDHHADVYAFGILLFEMFTGAPPQVDGLSWNMQQIMRSAALPVPAEMPDDIAAVLRKATAFDPKDRYNRTSEVIDALRALDVKTEPIASLFDDDLFLPANDPALAASIEATNLFQSAMEKWADGAGRFRLYDEDFQYLDSFYGSGDSWGLELDDAAQRLMLRAALEHSYNLDSWWQKVENPADRRAVALQTLSSELPTARLRAIEKLSAIEDSSPPAIPIRVATIISTDPDPDVRLAGVKLLEQRAVKSASGQWRDVAYSETIDGVLADLAANDAEPRVRESAARAIGRLRSSLAATHVSAEVTKGNAHARQSLIDIRDEAPNFPAGVPGDQRQRVFTALTLRQFFGRTFVPRYLSALLGFGLGWAVIQYVQFNKDTGGGNLLIAQAIGNSAASGALYGALVALAIVLAVEPASRLRAWSRPGRIILSAVLSTAVTVLSFAIVRAFYYFNPDPPEWPWLILVSLIFPLGFAVASGLTKRPIIRALVGGLGVFAALFIDYQLYTNETTGDMLLIFIAPEIAVTLALFMAFSLGLFTLLPEWLHNLNTLGKRPA